MGRILSEQDYQRLGRIVQAAEHNSPKETQRARTRRWFGGGTGVIEATVIRGLLDPDAGRDEETEGPVEGWSSYIVRLNSDTTAAWIESVPYLVGAYVTRPDMFGYNRKWRSVQSNNHHHDPATDDGTWWEAEAELAPVCKMQTPHNTGDMRTVQPRFFTNNSVHLIYEGGTWYFNGAFARIQNADGIQSLAYIGTRLAAVFGA